MACPDGCRATGQVSRIYANRFGTYIRLAGLSPATTPGDGHYFVLRAEHPKYNSLFSVILAAATNRYRVQVRTEEEIRPDDVPGAPGENADISYLVVDWS